MSESEKTKAVGRPPYRRSIRLARKVLRREGARAMLRVVNGVDWLTRDPKKLVGQTPYEEVFRQGMLALRHYPPLVNEDLELGTEVVEEPSPALFPVPVLLIPPLMVRPFIFDLVPGRSYVQTLLRAGFQVYLADLGQPRRNDQFLRLDDYVLGWIPTLVDEVCRHARIQQISLLGYCMGGLFALMHTSANEDARVRNIITIGSPVDSHRMGLLTWVIQHTHRQVDFLSRQLGNIPGDLSSAAFKMVAPLRNFTRYADLLINLWNEDYVNDFDALNQWTNNFTDYPGEAFRQLVNDFLVENKLKDGTWTFGKRTADLRRIRCSLLAFAGAADQIVPRSAVQQVMDLVSSEDREVRIVPGGHMGMFGGRRAPAEVWEASAAWLAPRSV